MISKLRSMLGLDSTSDKISRLIFIDQELCDINKSIDDNALEYTSRNEAVKKFKATKDLPSDIFKSVTDRFGIFQSTYLKEVIGLKKEKDKLELEKSKILSSENINKAYQEVVGYNKLKSAYKNGNITPIVFDTIMKAKQGKVKYADNIVFNSKGEILLIQRSNDDDSQPNKWVIPGGHVDVGENFDVAAKRELQEETGLFVDKVERVGTFTDKNVEIEYYRSVVDEENQPITIESTEGQDYKWINVSDIDGYEFPFNMKDNIKNILDIKDEPVEIEKASKQDKVVTVMKEFKEGKLKDSHGKTVTDRKQAVAIALSEAGMSKNEDEGELEKGKVTKNNAGYTDKESDTSKQCEYCKHWGGQNNCLVVSGKISPSGGCKLFCQAEIVAKIEKAFKEGKISKQVYDIVKARSGKYADTAENRRLKRVGQEYGSKKQDDTKDQTSSKKEDDKGSNNGNLEEEAKNATVSQLEAAIKESGNPEVRQAAHNELQRREKEEKPQSDENKKFGEGYEKQSEGDSDNKEGEKTQAKDNGEVKKEDSTKNKMNVTEKEYASGNVIIIGEEGGTRVRGVLSKDGKEFTIKSTFVSEGERGKGKAKEMYLQLLGNLKEKGVNKVKSDVQVEEVAGKIYSSLKKEGYAVTQNKLAVLEKDKTGNFWWCPEDDSQSPFEIDLKNNSVKKSEEDDILKSIQEWL